MRAPVILGFEMTTHAGDSFYSFERFPFYIEVWTAGGARPGSYEGRVFSPKPFYPGSRAWAKVNSPIFVCCAARRDYAAQHPHTTASANWEIVNTSAEARDRVQELLVKFLMEASEGLRFWLSLGEQVPEV